MNCKVCGYVRKTTERRLSRGQDVFNRGLCSRCYSKAWADGSLNEVALPATDPRKAKRAMWATEQTSAGYISIQTPDGVMLEHIYNMEKSMGRKLTKGENVHHLNGVRDDNRIENLELWYTAQPSGQRVQNLIDYLVEFHADKIIKAISLRSSE